MRDGDRSRIGRTFAALVLIVVGSAVLTLIGCPAAHDSFPGKACMTDSDCYQGEMCTSNMCQPPPLDMSIQLDFMRPDFSMPADLTGSDAQGTVGGDL